MPLRMPTSRCACTRHSGQGWKPLESQRKLFEQLEMPLVPVLSRVERNGVRIDAEMLREQSTELAGKMQEIEVRAFEEAGGEFNLSSPKQIQEILFDRLELPVIRKTPKGQPSTAEDVLHELAAEHELPRLILEHRGMGKLKSTYTDKLPLMVNAHSGRVHTSYHQAVAATGRLSSSDPNLQNIPIRTAEGRRIREAFIPATGNRLMAADYSQIELRNHGALVRRRESSGGVPRGGRRTPGNRCRSILAWGGRMSLLTRGGTRRQLISA